MSLSLLANPNKTPTTFLSNVNAAITQLPYTLLREDVRVLGIDDNGGFAEIQAGSLDVAILEVGDKMFWVNPPVEYAEFTGKIVTVTTIVDAFTYIIDVTFNGASVVANTQNDLSITDYSVRMRIFAEPVGRMAQRACCSQNLR